MSSIDWQQHTSIHLHVHSFRERISHAFRILTTGQTTYRYTFHHKGLGDVETQILIDDRVMIPIPNEDSR